MIQQNKKEYFTSFKFEFCIILCNLNFITGKNIIKSDLYLLDLFSLISYKSNAKFAPAHVVASHIPTLISYNIMPMWAHRFLGILISRSIRYGPNHSIAHPEFTKLKSLFS